MGNKVVTRFAPSPTGFLHAGNYRTALFCYLFARQNKGTFIVRIEDTDKARSKKEYEDNILETLGWMNLSYDALYRQSERTDIYKKFLTTLVTQGKAYVSKEEIKKEGDRAEVIRFKNPNRAVQFTDAIRGEITFDTTELGDFVIARSMDEPVFHLAVVVDDFLMEVTHVVRGEDHISNTPRHILIQEALGARTPVYAHLPLVLSPDKSKLSKRKGAKPLTSYRDQGFLPEAMINFLALIGWNPGNPKEIFSLNELVSDFSFSKIQKSGAIFNEEKLRWLNKEYIKLLPPDVLKKKMLHFLPKSISELPSIDKIIPMLTERIHYFGELSVVAEDFSYLIADPNYPKELLLWKKDLSNENTLRRLQEVKALLQNMPEEASPEKLKSVLMTYAEKEGRGEVLWPLRVALSGKEKSPDPLTLIHMLGTSISLRRIERACEMLRHH